MSSQPPESLWQQRSSICAFLCDWLLSYFKKIKPAPLALDSKYTFLSIREACFGLDHPASHSNI